MDVDLLSKMLKELILDNDRVGLPGVGTFVAEVVPSVFSDKGYTINPPYRKLYFRSKQENENLLVELYARSNALEIEVARRVVTDFALELRSVLYSKKTLALPGLGRLRATKENNVFFIADEDLDIFPSGFGLEPISLKTNQETPQEMAAAVEELKSILIETPSTPEEKITEEVAPEQPTELVPEQPTELAPEQPAEVATQQEETVVPTQSTEVLAPTPKTTKSKWLITVLLIILALALLLLAYMLVAQLCPELIDKLLYTEDELRIINSML